MLAHHYLQALELTAAAGGSTDAFADAARAALADAGDRASALNAFDAAARFFRAALDLLAGGGPGRGRLLYLHRPGRSTSSATPDPAMLERAVTELLAAGDVDGAAEAETTLCEQFWLEGGECHRHGAPRSGEGPSRRPRAVSGEGTDDRGRLEADDARRRTTKRRSGWARRRSRWRSSSTSPTSPRPHSSTSARAKTNLGETDGLELIARGVDAARAANAPFDICRGMGNLASFRWTRGDLGDCLALWGQARREAEDYGQTGFARWFRGVTVVAEYELGDWDASLATADAFIAEVEAGSPHYLAGECLHLPVVGQARPGRRPGCVARRRSRIRARSAGQGPPGRDPGLCRSSTRLHRAR